MKFMLTCNNDYRPFVPAVTSRYSNRYVCGEKFRHISYFRTTNNNFYHGLHDTTDRRKFAYIISVIFSV